MKNLENFGVQELNSLESKEIDGGSRIAYYFGYFIGRLVKQGPTNLEQMHKF